MQALPVARETFNAVAVSEPQILPVYAYFYPISTACPERQQRAGEHGVELTDETQLCQTAEPLFEGHDQPRTYAIGEKDGRPITQWDDADPEAMELQGKLALKYGVDGFIFDHYLGNVEGQTVHEHAGVMQAFLGSAACRNLEFATMSVLSRTRVSLPVPREGDTAEQNRDFDRSKETVEAIIDHHAQNYWGRDNYIWMRKRRERTLRPYMSVLVPYVGSEPYAPPGDNAQLSIADMLSYMKEYSERKYGIAPYLVAVTPRMADWRILQAAGADAVTGYAALPDFDSREPNIQSHDFLLNKLRTRNWIRAANRGGTADIPYIPPAVVGWDTSPRAERYTGATRLSNSYAGGDVWALEGPDFKYPYVPIVTDSSPEKFAEMLRLQQADTRANAGHTERYAIGKGRPPVALTLLILFLQDS